MTRPFAETSFICALYRQQSNSPVADRIRASLSGALPVSSLVLFEFRQSVRLQTRLHRHNPQLGFGSREGLAMLRDLQSDLAAGLYEVMAVDWPGVFVLAENLSAKHTEAGGHRFADILHVATALHLGVEHFLSFDANQQALARAEGLCIPPEMVARARA